MDVWEKVKIHMEMDVFEFCLTEICSDFFDLQHFCHFQKCPAYSWLQGTKRSLGQQRPTKTIQKNYLFDLWICCFMGM